MSGRPDAELDLLEAGPPTGSGPRRGAELQPTAVLEAAALPLDGQTKPTESRPKFAPDEAMVAAGVSQIRH